MTISNLAQESSTFPARRQEPFGESQHRPKPTAQDIAIAIKLSQLLLPGRQQVHVAKRLQKFILYLSGWRHIYMGRKRMARDLGVTVRTITRWFTLIGPDNLKLLRTGKVASEHGNKHRYLQLENLRREDVPSARREDVPQEVPKFKTIKKEEPDKPNTRFETETRRVSTEPTVPKLPIYGPKAETPEEAACRALDVETYGGEHPHQVAPRLLVRVLRTMEAHNGNLASLPMAISFYTTRRYAFRDERDETAELDEMEYVDSRLRSYARRHCSRQIQKQVRVLIREVNQHARELAAQWRVAVTA